MLTLDDLIIRYLDNTKDDDPSNRARGIRYINDLQRNIVSSEDYFWLEASYTITPTTVGQKSFNLPIAWRTIKNIKALSGSTQYILKEIPDFDAFDNLSSSTLVNSTYPSFYQIRNGNLLTFPGVSAVSTTMTVNYLKGAIDLNKSDYSTGTITATLNSATITGSGTSWNTSNISIGAGVLINNNVYYVQSVNSTTSITLTQVFQGTTASGLTYRIGDISVIPEDFVNILDVGATYRYWMKRENEAQLKYWKGEYLELEQRLRKNTSSKTTHNVIPRGGRAVLNINNYPQNIGS